LAQRRSKETTGRKLAESEPALGGGYHLLQYEHDRTRHSFTFVPNRRTSTFGFWLAGPVITHTAKNFLPTSIPAHRSALTSNMAFSFTKKNRRLISQFVSRA